MNDHSVDLVGRELELVSGERVGETEFHGREITRVDIAEKGRELLSDSSVKVVSGRIGNDRDSLELLLNRTSCMSAPLSTSDPINGCSEEMTYQV